MYFKLNLHKSYNYSNNHLIEQRQLQYTVYWITEHLFLKARVSRRTLIKAYFKENNQDHQTIKKDRQYTLTYKHIM